MGIRRRLLFGGKKSRLPNEYQEVEYIKTYQNTPNVAASDKSFICTGISNNTISAIVVRYGVIAFSGTQKPMIIASHANGSTNAIAPFVTVSGNASSGFSISPTIGSPYDGKTETYTITYPANQSGNLRIGGWGDTFWTAEGAYYFVVVYGANNSEIANFVPCYRKYDNKAGMYDIVGNAFYPSDGTLDFISGPSV